MGQVPQIPSYLPPSYLLIGYGRLGRHLEAYFKLENIPLKIWTCRQQNVPNSLGFGDLRREQIEGFSHVLLAIHDSAIEPFIREHEFLSEKTLIHFSGSLSTPLAESAHPLMTFSEQLYDLETYRKIPFVLEKGRRHFEELFPALKNPHYAIPQEQKTLYHALCVMSGNFTTILWEKFFKELEQTFRLPRELVYPYLAQIALNLQKGEASVLTGPLVRGDHTTIDRHLNVLGQDPFKEVYQSFVRAFVPAYDTQKAHVVQVPEHVTQRK